MHVTQAVPSNYTPTIYIYRAAASCGVFKSYFDRAIRDCSLVLQPAPEQYRLWRLLLVLFTPFLALALAL